jgi:peptidoglycan hydrolase-like protein with peptidoglycan-binding domain
LNVPPQRGDDVKGLQRALEGDVQVRLMDSQVGFDGIFGTLTELAVRKLQAQRGLLVDGIAGPLTLRALQLIV